LEQVLLHHSNGLHIGLAVYSILLFGYVFWVDGRRNRNKLKTRKEEDPFSVHSAKKWEDLWEITVKGNKDQEMSNTNWN
jgi:hypothetical protein